jgi:hypothetical protein
VREVLTQPVTGIPVIYLDTLWFNWILREVNETYSNVEGVSMILIDSTLASAGLVLATRNDDLRVEVVRDDNVLILGH